MRTWRRVIVGMMTVALAVTSLVGASGSAQAAITAPLDGALKPDKKAILKRVAGYGRDGGLRVEFKSPHKFNKRLVSLQTLVEPAPVPEGEAPVDTPMWREVAKAKMNSKGVVTFTSPLVDGATYRAVAYAHTYKDKKKKKRTAKPVATNTLEKVSAPKPTLFSFDKGNEEGWEPRNEGVYTSGGRLCSAPSKDNVDYDGKATLKVTKDKSTNTTVHKAAKAAQKKAGLKKKLQVGCKNGTYHNAMISTQGLFMVKTGTVSARVKFPLGQGMHASFWLQSADGAEIDIVESYGYGKGITSTIHTGGEKSKQYPKKESARWVAKSTVKKKSWWEAYHTVTATWNRESVTVWIDGTQVQKIKQLKPDTDYFLVLSLLTSDWELPRMTKPAKGAKGVKKTKLSAPNSKFYVDWIKVWAA